MAFDRNKVKIEFGRKNRMKQDREKSDRRKLIISVMTYMAEILVVIGIAYSITKYGILVTAMNGSSMEKTLYNDEDVLVNKFAYRLTEPGRNDVVAYRQEASEHSFLNIKRVIGLPGEKVRITDGKVYINGEELKEKINVDVMNTGGIASEEILLEENEYFVLGDNRNNSQDSRFSNVGTIIRDDIIGKVEFRLKPFSIVGRLNLADNKSGVEE